MTCDAAGSDGLRASDLMMFRLPGIATPQEATSPFAPTMRFCLSFGAEFKQNSREFSASENIAIRLSRTVQNANVALAAYA
jgi:hypothetical protein